jgi:hypothetical protein
MDKLSAWSEGHQSSEDSMHSLGDTGDERVHDRVVKRGVVLLTDCSHCGRQWKGIIPWPEVAAYYLGQAVPGSVATRQGIVNAMPCNGCNKEFRTVTDWDEVRRYIDVGVRMGLLSPKIKQAAGNR